MLDYLINLAGDLGHWAHLGIVIVVTLECQALLGLVMPGESLVLVGGFLAEQGLLDPGVLIFVVSIAAIIGDSIGYELGRHLGQGWLLKHGARYGLRQEHLDRVDDFVLRHGGKAAFGSHFLHLLRSLMPFVAGARRMAYPKFLLFNSMGYIVRVTTYLVLGYLAGRVGMWPRIGLVAPAKLSAARCCSLPPLVGFGIGWGGTRPMSSGAGSGFWIIRA